ncbi:MAG TPA: hypothetical protein VIL29_08755 [Pseudothermotoga sp.]
MQGLRKQIGVSRVEVGDEIFTFSAHDDSHPEIAQIKQKLDALLLKMRDAGYKPQIDSVLHDISDEEKEHSLCSHSEKLAIAYGLLKIPPDTPIRIINNLRVCSDCYTATKWISKLEQRKIIVRDAHRFHHFEDGKCSCNDYF